MTTIRLLVLMLSICGAGCVVGLPPDARPLNDLELQAVTIAAAEWDKTALPPVGTSCLEWVRAGYVLFEGDPEYSTLCPTASVACAKIRDGQSLIVARDTEELLGGYTLVHEALHQFSYCVYGDSDRTHTRPEVWLGDYSVVARGEYSYLAVPGIPAANEAAYNTAVLHSEGQ